MFILLAAALAQPASVQEPTRTPVAAASQQAAPDGAPNPMADMAAMETVVVRGSRIPGSVSTEVAPVQVIGGFEIRTYGATSLAELLQSIAPQVASVRGGTGRPVLLVNARRVNDFSELRDLPPEAIRRIEIFPEEVGLRYGASGGQRVVNIILNPRYRASQAQARVGISADGARDFGTLMVNRTGIDANSRTNLSLEGTLETAVTEDDLGLVTGSSRTLLPETRDLRASGSYGRALGWLGDQGWGSVGFDASTGDRDDVLGIATGLGNALKRLSDTDAFKLTGSLEGLNGGWRWSAIAVGETTAQDVRLDSSAGSGDRSSSDVAGVSLDINASRTLFELPAGAVTATLDGGLGTRSYEAVSVRSGVRTATDRDRLESSLSGNVTIPLARRRGGSPLGDLTLNLGGGIASTEDFGDQSSFTGGLTWAPSADVQLSLLGTSAQTAPTLADLAGPLSATPDSLVYDGRTGNSVRVTRLAGGTASLREESRQDLSLALSWSPQAVEGLTVSASVLDSRIDDPVGRVTLASDTVESWLPGLFSRTGGTLTSIDTRPLNFHSRDTRTLRWGVSFSQNFGGPPDFLADAQRRVMAADEANPGAPLQANGLPAGLTPPPGFRPPAGESGGPPPEFLQMLRSGNRLPGGRWTAAFSHEYKLSDELVLLPGQTALDLIDGDGIDADSGGRHAVTLEGGATYHGMGLRLNGTWTSGYDLRTGAETLSYDDRLTLNLRSFFMFDLRPELTLMVPFLRGSRIGFDIENITDSAPSVETANGTTPLALAAGNLEPEGRRYLLSFRKRF